MEFRFEDIVKNIIPGGVLSISIGIYFLGGLSTSDFDKLLSSSLKDYGEIILVTILVCFYLSGYFVDAAASLFEFYLIHELIGRPSYKLLTGKGNRIKLINHVSIADNIKAKFPNDHTLEFKGKEKFDRAVASKIFKYCNVLNSTSSKTENNSRIKEHYYSYIFSRNLFLSVLISSIIIMCRYWAQIRPIGFVSIVFMLILLYIRRRDRDYYYCRETLLVSNF